MKFAFEFDNVRTSKVFNRFEICLIFYVPVVEFEPQVYMIGITPAGHLNNQLNKCALPNSLKGPKIILDMADRHVSKDGPFRILGNALIYFWTSSVSLFFIFYHRHVNVWLNLHLHSHSNGFVLWMRIFLGFVTSLCLTLQKVKREHELVFGEHLGCICSLLKN